MEHTPKDVHLAATCPVCGTAGYEARDPCPLHAAAPALLSALEKGLKIIPRPQPTRRGITETGQRIIAWKDQARAAILAAKKGD